MPITALLVGVGAWAPVPAWAEPPRPIAGRIGQEDYPRAAIRSEAQGRVEALLTISETGAVASCVIARSSGHKLLDETTCRLVLARYRFDPARNREGKPIAVRAVLPVVWSLPPL